MVSSSSLTQPTWELILTWEGAGRGTLTSTGLRVPADCGPGAPCLLPPSPSYSYYLIRGLVQPLPPPPWSYHHLYFHPIPQKPTSSAMGGGGGKEKGGSLVTINNKSRVVVVMWDPTRTKEPTTAQSNYPKQIPRSPLGQIFLPMFLCKYPSSLL